MRGQSWTRSRVNSRAPGQSPKCPSLLTSPPLRLVHLDEGVELALERGLHHVRRQPRSLNAPVELVQVALVVRALVLAQASQICIKAFGHLEHRARARLTVAHHPRLARPAQRHGFADGPKLRVAQRMVRSAPGRSDRPWAARVKRHAQRLCDRVSLHPASSTIASVESDPTSFATRARPIATPSRSMKNGMTPHERVAVADGP